jgi:hypothetical protein
MIVSLIMDQQSTIIQLYFEELANFSIQLTL